jgi:hypothetical protein
MRIEAGPHTRGIIAGERVRGGGVSGVCLGWMKALAVLMPYWCSLCVVDEPARAYRAMRMWCLVSPFEPAVSRKRGNKIAGSS